MEILELFLSNSKHIKCGLGAGSRRSWCLQGCRALVQDIIQVLLKHLKHLKQILLLEIAMIDKHNMTTSVLFETMLG